MRLLGVVVAAVVWPLLGWAGDAAFRSTVASGLGAPVVFHTEFLDLPPTPSAAREQRLRDLLRVKPCDIIDDGQRASEVIRRWRRGPSPS